MVFIIVKRIIDLFLGIFLLLVLLPLLVLVSFLLFLANQGSPFFTQLRPGLHEKIFLLIKFKTMNDNKDANDNLLPDSKRLTPIGRFVRSTSLDEIPQLINVVKGDMSLIGPRPLLVKYLPLYNDFQKRRHEVRPGITGWAQVNGRNAISWEEKFKLDVWYVDNMSFALDMKILWMTLVKVFKREGISSGSSVTMEAFKGSSEK